MLRKQTHATPQGSFILWLWCAVTACTPISPVSPREQKQDAVSAAGATSSEPTSATATSSADASATTPDRQCSAAGSFACASNESRTRLMCDGERWVREAPCADDERCDDSAGAGASCLKIAAECIGRRSGELFCGDTDVRACNALIPSVVQTCEASQRCMLVNGAPACECAFGTIAKAGRCVEATDCTDSGGCDPETTCTSIGGERTCSACPDGFSGDGLQGCVPQLTALEVRGAVLDPVFMRDVDTFNVTLPLLQQRLELTAKSAPHTRVEVDDTELGADGTWSSAVLPLDRHSVALNVISESGLSSRYRIQAEHKSIDELPLKPELAEPEDAYGHALAVSNDTLVVGAMYEDSAASGVNGDEKDNAATESGAVYVYERIGDAWVQQAYLKSDAPSTNDFFGLNVALSGDTIAISATRSSPYSTLGTARNGLVYVFTRTGRVWTQQARLSAPQASGPDLFGYGLALQGDRLVVGAPLDGASGRDSGALYVFTRTGSSWSAPVKLKAARPAAESYLGWSVAMDGDTIVAGAHHNNQGLGSSNSPGAAHVFVAQSNEWSEQQVLQAPTPMAADFFGWSVSLRADTVVIGSPHGDYVTSAVCRSGYAYVFERTAEQWTATATLEPIRPRDCDFFGTSVALGSGGLAIGASGDADAGNTVNAGAVYLYARTDAKSWTRSALLKAAAVTQGANFGKRVEIADNAVVVGAPTDFAKVGATYVFR